MNDVLHKIITIAAPIFIGAGSITFIIGWALTVESRGTYQTSWVNALAWTGGSQTHEYHYEAQESFGHKLMGWGILPYIAGIAVLPGISWSA